MKKTMKRIFAIIAVLALCLSLAACGSSGGDEITVQIGRASCRERV